MPRLSGEARAQRDAMVFQLFLAGVPLRQIGSHDRVGLSCRGVELAIRRQLKATAARRDLLADEAVAVHDERLEGLYAIAFKKAAGGDMRATEQCRRLLEQMGRLRGSVVGVGRGSGLPPSSLDGGGDDDEDFELIDLEEKRWVRNQNRAAGSRSTS